jgi:hypothetical protein
VGATYRQTRTIPRRSEESFEVTDFAPPSRLAINGQIGPLHATSSYLLQPTADGTRLTNHVELEPTSALLRPIGPLAVPAVKAAVARNLDTLKQLRKAPALHPGETSHKYPRRWRQCSGATAGRLSVNLSERITAKITKTVRQRYPVPGAPKQVIRTHFSLNRGRSPAAPTRQATKHR